MAAHEREAPQRPPNRVGVDQKTLIPQCVLDVADRKGIGRGGRDHWLVDLEGYRRDIILDKAAGLEMLRTARYPVGLPPATYN